MEPTIASHVANFLTAEYPELVKDKEVNGVIYMEANFQDYPSMTSYPWSDIRKLLIELDCNIYNDFSFSIRPSPCSNYYIHKATFAFRALFLAKFSEVQAKIKTLLQDERRARQLETYDNFISKLSSNERLLELIN